MKPWGAYGIWAQGEKQELRQWFHQTAGASSRVLVVPSNCAREAEEVRWAKAAGVTCFESSATSSAALYNEALGRLDPQVSAALVLSVGETLRGVAASRAFGLLDQETRWVRTPVYRDCEQSAQPRWVPRRGRIEPRIHAIDGGSWIETERCPAWKPAGTARQAGVDFDLGVSSTVGPWILPVELLSPAQRLIREVWIARRDENWVHCRELCSAILEDTPLNQPFELGRSARSFLMRTLTESQGHLMFPTEDRIEGYLKAALLSPTEREAWVYLSVELAKAGQWERCLESAIHAELAHGPEASWEIDLRVWGSLLNDLFLLCSQNLRLAHSEIQNRIRAYPRALEWGTHV